MAEDVVTQNAVNGSEIKAGINSYQKYLQWAWFLSLITIVYNFLEGIVSAYFGISEGTLALLGFGVDSYVEVISGLGIAHMVFRMRKLSVHAIKTPQTDRFERRALKITGTAFYLLTAGLVMGAGWNIYQGHTPQSTVSGIVIATLSILTMYFLYFYKKKAGQALDSAPIISDANCTLTCFYLSFILLASSLLYEWLQIPYIDAAGSLGIAIFAFREGREAFEKARNNSLSCSDDCC